VREGRPCPVAWLARKYADTDTVAAATINRQVGAAIVVPRHESGRTGLGLPQSAPGCRGICLQNPWHPMPGTATAPDCIKMRAPRGDPPLPPRCWSSRSAFQAVVSASRPILGHRAKFVPARKQTSRMNMLAVAVLRRTSDPLQPFSAIRVSMWWCAVSG
jgi:hypothetical protein